MSTLVLGAHSFSEVPDVNGTLVLLNAGGTPSILTNTLANRPAAGTAGRLFVDTTNSLLQRDTGSTWVNVGFVPTLPLVGILDKTTTNQVVTVAGPTNILSYTVPGGTLGTQGIIRLQMQGLWLNSSGATRTVTVAVSYGGTTLYADTSATLATANDAGWSIQLFLCANNSVTSQTLTGIIDIGNTGGVTTGIAGDLSTDETTSVGNVVGVNSAVNSAINQNFNVSVTFNGAGITFTKYFHILELL